MFSLPWATTRPDQTGPSSQVHTLSLTHGHCHQTYFPPSRPDLSSSCLRPSSPFSLLPPPPPHHHHDRLSLCNLSSRDPSSALSVACTSILFVPCVLSLLPFVDRIPLGAKFIRSIIILFSCPDLRPVRRASCRDHLPYRALSIFGPTQVKPRTTETLTSFPSRSSTKIRSTLCGYYEFRSDREP